LHRQRAVNHDARRKQILIDLKPHGGKVTVCVRLAAAGDDEQKGQQQGKGLEKADAPGNRTRSCAVPWGRVQGHCLLSDSPQDRLGMKKPRVEHALHCPCAVCGSQELFGVIRNGSGKTTSWSAILSGAIQSVCIPLTPMSGDGRQDRREYRHLGPLG
jgi:hypothetical protein